MSATFRPYAAAAVRLAPATAAEQGRGTCLAHATHPSEVNQNNTSPRTHVPPNLLEHACDIMGNPLATLPTQWPLARPLLAKRDERLQRVELRLGYAWAIQKIQQAAGVSVLPPCTWCGMPTGGWCDFCMSNPAKAICSQCGGTDADSLASCRDCTMPAVR